MQLTREQVEKFSNIFTRHTGQTLTYDEAQYSGNEIVELIRLALVNAVQN
jgi:hypothetical protein